MSLFIITTEADDRSLLTVTEARTAIGNTTADVTALIARVSAAITRACRVPASGATPPTLRLETLQETYRLKSSQDKLVLARSPAIEIVSLVENDTTLTEGTDFELDSAAGILHRLSGDSTVAWPCGKIVVTYPAGWETVPDDLKLAAVKLAAVFWSEGGKTDPNLKRQSIPGVIDQEWWVSQNDDKAIPQEVIDLLGPYMNHWIG